MLSTSRRCDAPEGILSCRPRLAEAFARLRTDPSARVILLTGSEGTGKRTCARAMAALWLDEPLEQLDSHPDYLEISTFSKSQLISAETLRESVCKEVVLPPRMGGLRVVFLPADALQEMTQNLLLKTLEEAPASTRLILTASAESSVLETIRSRCLKLRVDPLDEPSFRAVLAAEMTPEQQAQLAKPARQAFLYAYARGCPGPALTALGQAGFWERTGALAEGFYRLIQGQPEDWLHLQKMWEDPSWLAIHLRLTAFYWEQIASPLPPAWPAVKAFRKRWGDDFAACVMRCQRLVGWVDETQRALAAHVQRDVAITRLLMRTRKELLDAETHRRAISRRG